ncbi:zinc dependent phospholipase C family protein [Abyssisolibacter fermentans]|uniref:zinc dependent phospholipase C family protein n=1 Tax=Abyssisolibacter fermentans TaxID=1766203 RepID=UPI00082E8F3F|nr:zinc dependent phospholipase C family protein [Abyssisolibacter fermentans]
MASRIIHLAVSERVAEHFGLDLGRFNLGNLLPDLHENTRESKAISHFRIAREPYEDAKTDEYQYFDYDRFLQKYKRKIHDDLYLGYYCHLITDELWIQNIYIKYMRDENRKKRIDQQKNYYHDFSRLNQIIKEKYNLKMNVVFETTQISEINYKKTSELEIALENDFKTKYDDLDLLLFNYEDIITFVEEASSAIIENLEKIELR